MNINCNKDDIFAVPYLHKFNDHNLRLMDIKEQLK